MEKNVYMTTNVHSCSIRELKEKVKEYSIKNLQMINLTRYLSVNKSHSKIFL